MGTYNDICDGSGGCAGTPCAANTFDANGLAIDDCEAGCPAVTHATCDTCSAHYAVDGCATSGTAHTTEGAGGAARPWLTASGS